MPWTYISVEAGVRELLRRSLPEGVPRMVMAEMKEQAREMVVGTSLVM